MAHLFLADESSAAATTHSHHQGPYTLTRLHPLLGFPDEVLLEIIENVGVDSRQLQSGALRRGVQNIHLIQLALVCRRFYEPVDLVLNKKITLIQTGRKNPLLLLQLLLKQPLFAFNVTVLDCSQSYLEGSINDLTIEACAPILEKMTASGRPGAHASLLKDLKSNSWQAIMAVVQFLLPNLEDLTLYTSARLKHFDVGMSQRNSFPNLKSLTLVHMDSASPSWSRRRYIPGSTLTRTSPPLLNLPSLIELTLITDGEPSSFGTSHAADLLMLSSFDTSDKSNVQVLRLCQIPVPFDILIPFLKRNFMRLRVLEVWHLVCNTGGWCRDIMVQLGDGLAQLEHSLEELVLLGIDCSTMPKFLETLAQPRTGLSKFTKLHSVVACAIFFQDIPVEKPSHMECIAWMLSQMPPSLQKLELRACRFTTMDIWLSAIEIVKNHIPCLNKLVLEYSRYQEDGGFCKSHSLLDFLQKQIDEKEAPYFKRAKGLYKSHGIELAIKLTLPSGIVKHW
ncbi:hypothetical protein BJ875DRAFT_487334 [Amylocarpus encephaloides]|uniref:F-box domain-containing protein n=1 Tax=Amylocarpus encephaloides TaxID=45428 RepID=A0A9P8C3K9_9HELO|nr:hypothetical protein BJ875DRAFT_487334 [Amylocarpus encephaloides]